MPKSPDAFRTISEVSDWLDTKPHVLRFWESKFKDISPVKRAGGRRYYRPEDMRLIGGIKKLLHDDGMTIKGVQKLLASQGVDHVAALSQPLDVAAYDNVVAVISDDTSRTTQNKTRANTETTPPPVDDIDSVAPAPVDAPVDQVPVTEKTPNVVTLENTLGGDVDSTEPLLFPEIEDDELWDDAASADEISKVVPLTPRVTKMDVEKPNVVFEPMPVQRPVAPITTLYSHTPALRAKAAASKKAEIVNLIRWAEKRVAS